MEFNKLNINEDLRKMNTNLEEVVNFGVRNFDKIMGMLGLGGRKADYDDENFEFIGGPNEELRKKHYDKSFRLLWKAERQAPWSSFNDASKEEISHDLAEMNDMAEKSLSKEEKKEYVKIKSKEYREFLDKTYTLDQKKALVSILSIIGHGEAYAWLVSSELLRDVKSTGGKAALTMQVMEEAKHFVVLRELIYAFDVEVPRLQSWEYLVLEGSLKSKGLEKFFGMNILIEGIALSIFGAMSKYPGLDILRLFHLDESRHTALPTNYFKTQPMNAWEKFNPISMFTRVALIFPAIPMVMKVEPDFAELGVDVFHFGGSLVRKVIHLAYRVGFYMPLPQETLKEAINLVFNAYCFATRDGHKFQQFLDSESTLGEHELEVEKEVFQLHLAS